MKRLVAGVLLAATCLVFSMAVYSYRMAPPVEPAVRFGGLIGREMERTGAKFAIVGTDGLVLFYSAAGLVGQLELVQKDRPGVSGGGMDDGRAYPLRDDVISVTRDVKGGKH